MRQIAAFILGRFTVSLAGIALLAMPALTGCATGTRLDSVQEQLGVLQEEIARLGERTAAGTEVAALGELIAAQQTGRQRDRSEDQRRLDVLAAEVARMASNLGQADDRLEQLTRELVELRLQVEELSAALTATRESRVPRSPPPPPDLPADPQILYDGAYALFQEGSCGRSIAEFERYLAAFPDAELADNATYWIGECYYLQQRLRQAISQFDRVISRYPDSDRIPSALLKKGYAYLELDQLEAGAAQLRQVIGTYPGSDEAHLAEQRLQELQERGIDAGG